MKRSGDTQEVSFISNGLELKGVLHHAGKENTPVVIGSHGLLSTKESRKQIVLAEKCCEYGISYLRIDHTGCGESQGELVKTTLDTRVGDILAAAGFLEESGFRNAPMALFGSSMGGATCIKSWNELVKAGYAMKCLVTLAAPVQGKTITETTLANEDELNGIPLSFYTENMGFDLKKNIEGLNNILIFHGDEDEIVPFSNAGTILEHAGPEKKLIVNTGGDHRMTDPAHQERFFAQASRWFNKYMSCEV